MAGTPFEAFMVKNGVDDTMVEGMGAPYDMPLNLTAHTAKANVPVLWWRSVGSTHTAFVMETLIDEAAHVAGMDPVAYRKTLIGDKHKRHLAALDLAVAKSGYGKKKLPKGPRLRRRDARVVQFGGRVRGRGVGGQGRAEAAQGHRRRALQPGRQSADDRSAGAGRAC